MEIRDIKFLHPIIRTILGEKSNHFDELTQKLVEKFNAKPHINFMNPSSDNLDKFRLEYYLIAMMFLSSFDCSIKTEIQKEISKILSLNEHQQMMITLINVYVAQNFSLNLPMIFLIAPNVVSNIQMKKKILILHISKVILPIKLLASVKF